MDNLVLQKILVAFTECCNETNAMYELIDDNTENWLDSIIDCCENVNGNLDSIIDLLEDWAADYTATYGDFECQEYDNSIIDFEIDFENYLCQQVTTTTTTAVTTSTTTLPTTTTTTINPTQIDYEIGFENRLCQQTLDPSASTTTTTVVDIIVFSAEYSNFECQQINNPSISTTTTTSGSTTTTTSVAPGDVNFVATYGDFECQQVDNGMSTTTTTTTINEDDVDFEIDFEDYLCQQVTTTTTTVGSTTTTSTTAGSTTTTTTSAPTTTTTTTITSAVACGNEVTGIKTYPSIYEVDLGTGIGQVVLTFDTVSVPDKFVVLFDGIEVINTGYRGDSEYQAILYDALSDVGAPSENITGGKTGTASFIKTSPTDKAYVYVYAPIEETEWDFILACPSTVSTTTTTTNPTEVDFTATYGDFECQQEFTGTTTTTTTTGTTTSTTSTTVSTTTTTIELPCEGGFANGQGSVFPIVYNINLGTGTGNVLFSYDSEDIPDKYIVVFDGAEVINTGYRGDSALQSVLDARLTQIGEPTETIQGSGTGTIIFNKSTATTIATVYVYAPIQETKWGFTMECPQVGFTSTTTTIPPTTTTTTTLTENCVGFLYNWWGAIGDTDGDHSPDTSIVNTVDNPATWSLPSDDDYKTLEVYIGMSPAEANNFNDRGTTEGGELKETGTEWWDSPNTGATNEWDFDGRGSGVRNITGNFVALKEFLNLWTSVGGTGPLIDVAIDRQIEHDKSTINRAYGNKNEGYAIRLVDNSTTLSHGEEGIYIGNDGKIYPTICIGTQEWLAVSLKETKYLDGSSIPLVTDATEWGNLTNAAYSIYNNNPDDCDAFTTTTTTGPTTTTTTVAPTTTTTTEAPPPVSDTVKTFAHYPGTCGIASYPSTVFLANPQSFGTGYFDPDELNTNIEYIKINSYSSDSGYSVLYNGSEISGGDTLNVNISGAFEFGNMQHKRNAEGTNMLYSVIKLQIKLRDNATLTEEVTLYTRFYGCVPPATTTTTTI